VGSVIPGVASAPTYPALIPCRTSFFLLLFQRGATSPQGTFSRFPKPAENSIWSFHELQLYDLLQGLIVWSSSSQS
jgi:hypothetical protein